MQFIKNMKIRAKLFLGFFLLVIIATFIAVYGIISIGQINEANRLMYDHPSTRYNQLNYLSTEIMDLRRIVTAMAFRIADHENLNALYADARALRNSVERLIDAYVDNQRRDELIDPARREYLIGEAETLREMIYRYIDDVLDGMYHAAREGIVGDYASRARIDEYLQAGGDLYDEIAATFAILREGAQQTMENRYYEIQANAAATTVIMIIMAIIGIVIGVTVALYIATMVTRPIVLLSKALEDVAAGDLTQRIPDQGKDEAGMAANSYNSSMDEFGKMIGSVKNMAGTLSEIGAELASNMTETASAMNEITANIQSIKGRVLNQSASVTETNSTMEQVTVNISKLSQHVDRQSTAVAQSSSAIEEMIANIQSVTGTLTKNAANVKELQESSEIGRGSLQEVAGDIQEIARESEGLMEINSVMENIASQTNLLSMNAAIEAAHAGDAGRGFAVVAAEIRKLAESSGAQSKTIGTVLKKIKESIDKITRSTDKVMSRFETIELGVKTVAEQEENILHAMEEQSHGSKQILQASGEVNNVTQQVKSGSVEMLQGSKEVIQESKNLERVTQEITQGMNEMAVGAEQINKAVSTVNDLSGKTKDNISSLVQAVSRFKV
ncbi:MAG: methyl-accepting chemotaxis protein [Treponema sp.]|nr:methyl-accepting chemotaxis protein [Treponema sp.]